MNRRRRYKAKARRRTKQILLRFWHRFNKLVYVGFPSPP